MAALTESCECGAVTSCDKSEADLAECRHNTLNCENTLEFSRKKTEKYTALYDKAHKNYTELREECQGYYDDHKVSVKVTMMTFR